MINKQYHGIYLIFVYHIAIVVNVLRNDNLKNDGCYYAKWCTVCCDYIGSIHVVFVTNMIVVRVGLEIFQFKDYSYVNNTIKELCDAIQMHDATVIVYNVMKEKYVYL